MEAFLSIVEKGNEMVNKVVWGPVMLCFLLFVGIQFTFRLRFFQLTKIRLWMRHTLGSFLHPRKKKDKNSKAISPFQAMTTALAGAIGTGNIVGVATAITLGGPGAIFWMWVASFFGMMTVFAENILGIRYRCKNQKGEWTGGPMYYIEKGLHQKWLAVAFSVACILASFGMGNMTQANSIAGALQEGFGVSPKITGVLIAMLVGFIIFGGIQRIAKVTEKVVPFMALFYMAGAVVVMVVHASSVPGVLKDIVQQAFQLQSAAGGAGGCVMAAAVKYGVARGVFSNEAGLGSTPIVHSASDTKEPVEQGMWGIFQVFLDTLVMCTMTALCILASGAAESGKEGVALSTAAFSTVFGKFGSLFVAVSIVLFAFATIVGWSFYGERSIEYLSGGSRKSIPIYKAVYVVAVAFGCVMDLRLVWSISDTFNGLMAIPNLIALLLLSSQVVSITKDYLSRPQISHIKRKQKQREKGMQKAKRRSGFL